MTGRTTRYIRGFEFGSADDFTLSDTGKITAQGGVVRLAKVRGAVQLPGRPIDAYSLDDDIYVRTRTFSPGVLRSFDFVETFGNEPADEDDVQVTSFAFRLFDGTDQRFWSGAAWDVAGAGDWNTLADFNANLSAFTGASIALELRLKTTDDQITPYLTGLCMRWTGDVIDSYKEWIYKTVIRSLKNNIRPLTDLTLASDGAITVNLSSFFDAGFDLADVIAAYDHTADPTHLANLIASFDAITKVATLTAAVPVNNNVWLTASYAPDVAVTTSTDFVADAKVPALWITSVAPRGPQKKLGGRGPAVIDRSLAVPEGTAFALPIPLVDLDFTIAVITSTALDLTRLTQALAGWMETHPTLRSPSLDEEVALSDGSLLSWATDNADADDTRVTTNSFSLLNIPLFHDGAQSAANDGVNLGPTDGVKGVKRVVFNWQPASGGDEQTTT